MRTFFAASALALTVAALALSLSSWRAMPRQIDAGGHRLRMSISGRERPTVVFDCFGPANLEIWSRIQRDVSRFATCVSFDHGSFWGSEPGPVPRDARQLARELHVALANAQIPPPYLLVGYSMGGIYTRVFAGEYPREIAGIVLVDPTSEEFMTWLQERFPEMVRISAKHREAQDEMGCLWNSFDQARRSRLPDVHLSLITGAKPFDNLTRHLMPHWLAAHQEWLAQFPAARHIVTRDSGHDVVEKEPELVVAAIRDAVDAWRRTPMLVPRASGAPSNHVRGAAFDQR